MLISGHSLEEKAARLLISLNFCSLYDAAGSQLRTSRRDKDMVCMWFSWFAAIGAFILEQCWLGNFIKWVLVIRLCSAGIQNQLFALLCFTAVSAPVGHWWNNTFLLSFFCFAASYDSLRFTNHSDHVLNAFLLICSESLLLLPLSECRRVCEIQHRPISVWLHRHRLLRGQLYCS